jgi:hypothetical protein
MHVVDDTNNAVRLYSNTMSWTSETLVLHCTYYYLTVRRVIIAIRKQGAARAAGARALAVACSRRTYTEDESRREYNEAGSQKSKD